MAAALADRIVHAASVGPDERAQRALRVAEDHERAVAARDAAQRAGIDLNDRIAARRARLGDEAAHHRGLVEDQRAERRTRSATMTPDEIAAADTARDAFVEQRRRDAERSQQLATSPGPRRGGPGIGTDDDATRRRREAQRRAAVRRSIGPPDHGHDHGIGR